MTDACYLYSFERNRQEIFDLAKVLESSLDEADEICRNILAVQEHLGLDTSNFSFIAHEAYKQALHSVQQKS